MDAKAAIEHSILSHRLDGTNYRSWKFQINAILRSQDLLGIVDGSSAKPANDADEKTKSAWLQKDGKATAILFASVNQENASDLLDCKSAKSIMDSLESIHQKKSDVRIMTLYEEYFSLKMSNDESVSAYVSKVRTIASELEDQGEQLTDNLKMCRIVSSLTPKFQHFRSIWYNIKEGRTMDTLMSKLQLEEDQLRKSERDTLQSSESQLTGAAFSAKHIDTKKKKKNFSLSERQAKSKCHQCGQVGHWKKDCVANNSKDGGGSNNNNKNGKTVSYAAIDETLSADYNDVWISDSGASRHTTFRRDWFKSFSSNGVQNGIKIANDEILHVEGSGTIEIEAFVDGKWETQILEDVRFVPKSKVNLFSVNQLTNKGFNTTFTNEGCNVKRLSDGKVVSIGYKDCNNIVRMVFRHKTVERACASIEKVSANTLQQWHRRLGHVNTATIKTMCSNGSVSGIKLTDQINFFCEECQLGKMHRSSHPVSERLVLEKGECFHVDLCGPMEQTGIDGVRFCMMLKDEGTGFRFVYFLKQKSDAVEFLEDFLLKASNVWNAKIKHIRYDNGTEFINNDVTKLMSKHGIILDRIAPYTPEQNGVIERDNRTVGESARTMLIASGLSKALWPEAMRTAVFMLNRTTNKKNTKQTPYELWFGQKPYLGHIKVFGTTGFVHIPKIGRKKWDAKAKKVYLVGFEATSKNFRLYDPETQKVKVSCDVNFNENSVRSEYITFRSNDESDDESVVNSTSDVSSSSSGCQQSTNSTQQASNRNSDEDEDDEIERRSLRKNPAQVQKYDADKGCLAICVEPNTYEEAIQSEHSTEWKRAIEEELQSLKENETWDIIDKPNNCMNVVGSKWVFKLKSAPNEEPRFKARVVAKGYSQSEGVDYQETFAPVVRYDTVRVVLALAAIHDMEIAQFDVKTAFLNGKLDELIYMKVPDGVKHSDGQVCRLKRSLYRLKQSSRVWNARFVDFVRGCNMEQSQSDPSVFHGSIDGEKVILLLYVDDRLILSRSQTAIDSLIDKLQNTFKITLSNANWYAGLEIERNREQKTISIGQRTYIDKIVRKYNMEDSKSISTPADIGTILTTVSDSDCDNKFPYRSACGSLTFAATVSRPDISYSVGEVSRFMAHPNQLHVNAIKRIFRYLNHTKNMKITYGAGNGKVLGYTDADHARDPETSRSVTGYAFMLGNGVVTWKSKQQSHVTLATAESEYVALCDGSKEAIWLQHLIKDFGYEQSDKIKMLCDNLSTIRWVKNPQQHHKTKHINKKLHFVREMYQNGEIQLEHVNGDDQLADVFTKPLSAIKFNSNVARLGLENSK